MCSDFSIRFDKSRPFRRLGAAAAGLVLSCLAFLPAAAADRSAVIVDLSVLDALDVPAGPSWVPPLPGHRPAPPLRRPIRAATEVEARPARTPDISPAARANPASRPTTVPGQGPELQPSPILWTAPVLWARPIPVTAGVLLAQQVGARSTAAAPSIADKAVGADVDVEATVGSVSALPDGDGFRILFVDDRTALTDTGTRLLDTLADRMVVQTDLRLRVMAYAGGTPETASRARLLSLERALAVRNYLFDQGVRGSRIDIRALGSTFVEGPAERVDLKLTD